MWPGVAWFLLAAWRAAAPDAEADEEPEGEDDEEESSGEEQEAAQPAPETPRLPTWGELGEALARVGTPHAHIAVLAEDLGTTPERVREALDWCGVPVEAARMRGRGSSTGVKGAALPTPRTAHADVVAAGQPGNNNDNNAHGPIVERPVEGMTIIRDPAETALRKHAV
ncbi:hypothetical protein ACWDSL_49595 [Streptomyces sp. NPDC000941]